MAFTKKHKGEMTAQYEEWLQKSQAVYALNYVAMNMKAIDDFRDKSS